MEYLDKNFQIVAGTALLGAIGVTCYLLLRPSSDTQQNLELTMSCKCGKVRAKILVPPSSRRAPHLNIYCCCHDCVNFAKHVQEKGKINEKLVFAKNFTAVEMVQFFKSDLERLEGADLIQACKLKDDSQIYRYYAKCCSTPIGLQPVVFSPIISFYRNILKPRDTFGECKNVVFVSRLPEGEQIPPSITSSKFLGAHFIFLMISRIIYGICFGKGKPNLFDSVDHSKIEVLECN